MNNPRILEPAEVQLAMSELTGWMLKGHIDLTYGRTCQCHKKATSKVTSKVCRANLVKPVGVT